MRESCFYCFSKTPYLVYIEDPIDRKGRIPICPYCLKYHLFKSYLNVFYENNGKNKYLLLLLRRYAKLLYRLNRHSANNNNMDKIDKAIKILATTKYHTLYYFSRKRSSELLKLLLC